MAVFWLNKYTKVFSHWSNACVSLFCKSVPDKSRVHDLLLKLESNPANVALVSEPDLEALLDLDTDDSQFNRWLDIRYFLNPLPYQAVDVNICVSWILLVIERYYQHFCPKSIEIRVEFKLSGFFHRTYLVIYTIFFCYVELNTMFCGCIREKAKKEITRGYYRAHPH